MPGGGGTTTTQQNDPWGPQQPFLKELYGLSQSQFNQPIAQFLGNRVGGLSANTSEAAAGGLNMIRGAGGGPGADYMQQLLGGQFLDQANNVPLQNMMRSGASDITRQFQTAVAPGLSMGNIGRSGSGAEANMAGQAYRGLGDALSANYMNTMGQNYNMERGFQQQGIGMLGQFDANTRSNLGTGAMLGQPLEQYGQRNINEQVRRFDFQQREPGERLDTYIQRIMGGGVLPGTSSSTTSGGGGGGMQAAGMGIQLLGAMAMMSSRGWKNKHAEVDGQAALQALATLDIDIWDYTQEFQAQQVADGKPADSAKHIGPYAEDFAQILGLGDGKTISFIDIIGFALAATKGAGEQIKELAEALGTALDRVSVLEKTVGVRPALTEVPA